MFYLRYLFEVWKPVCGFEGLYEVSNFGRVKSLIGKEKLLKLHKHNGYMLIGLVKNKQRKMCLVHRLVAEAFLPNPDNLPQVNHKDENKSNNFVWVNPDGSVDPEKSNLEWCTQKYNTLYGTCIERIKKKTKNRDMSFCEKAVISTDKNGVEQFFKSMAYAETLGFGNHSGIAATCKGKQNTHNGYKWRYA